MRGVLTASFPDTATIRRKSSAADGQGGQTETYADAGALACRLVARQQGALRESREGDRPVAATLWGALFPQGSDVRPTDRLRVGGTDYEVLEGDGARSEGLCLEVALKRVS